MLGKLKGILAVLVLSMTGAYALVSADEGDGRNCCSKSNECRYVDDESTCNAEGAGNGCSGTYGYCCPGACRPRTDG